MRVTFYTLLILALLFGACYSHTCLNLSKNSKTIYNIKIDKSLTNEEVEATLLGFEDWAKESGNSIEYYFSIIDFEIEKNNYPNYNDIFIMAIDADESVKAETLGFYDRKFFRKFIFIIKGKIKAKDKLKNLMTHEFGHFFGLNHSKDSDSVMFPYIFDSPSKIKMENKKDFCNNVCCK